MILKRGDDEMNTVADRLKELRENRMINAKDLCNAIDLNTSTYSKLENGKKSIDVDELRKLTKYFSVTADFILGIGKPQKDVVAYMKTDKNLGEEDINEIQMIFSMMDDATALMGMKSRMR